MSFVNTRGTRRGPIARRRLAACRALAAAIARARYPMAKTVLMRQMRAFGCGRGAVAAPVIIRPRPRPRPPYLYPPVHPTPYPRPHPTPMGGCGPGRKFDSCGCRCVDKDAITPQCIRNCTSCGVGQVFNWCTMSCVPIASKIRQCPPLDGSTVGSYYVYHYQ